jgi:hypothetical protein
MTRSTKKFVYGLFYLFVGFLFAWWVYGLFLKPAPTCFDRIKNQGEEGVDCGGPCVSCKIMALEPLRVSGEVRVFGLSSGAAAILAEVLNPNNNYAVRQVSYRIMIYDKDGLLLKTISRSTSFYPGEFKYIYEAGFDIPFSRIGKTAVEFDSPDWISGQEVFKPNIAVSPGFQTEERDGGIKVTGVVRNLGPVAAQGVKVIAIVANRFGQDLFAVQTFLGDVNGFGEQSFAALFPKDDIFREVDPGATKVFLTN